MLVPECKSPKSVAFPSVAMVTNSIELSVDGCEPPAANALTVLPAVSAYFLSVINSPNLVEFHFDAISIDCIIFCSAEAGLIVTPPNIIPRVGELAPFT